MGIKLFYANQLLRAIRSGKEVDLSITEVIRYKRQKRRKPKSTLSPKRHWPSQYELVTRLQDGSLTREVVYNQESLK